MTQYDDAFYDVIDEGSCRSADIVVPMLTPMLGGRPFSTLVDVGCGSGSWARAWKVASWHVTGLDGPAASERAAPRMDRFVAWDLERGDLTGFGEFDVATCLEVAEHLRPQYADRLVEGLCELASTILFSAAIPGQGGTGHVNEQWPDYWADKFKAQGKRVSGALRFLLWDHAVRGEVENWYAQNMLLIGDRWSPMWELLDSMTGFVIDEPLRLVHPVLYSHVHPGHP